VKSSRARANQSSPLPSLASPGTGKKPAKVSRPQTTADAVTVPSDLTADERYIWRRWAPHAIAKRTLTPQTVIGFRFLLECELERRAMKATIDTDGVVIVTETRKGQSTIAHPLLGAYGKLQKLVEVNLAPFGLSVFGKAEPDLSAAPIVNPWAEIGR
jgi:hypothetical protein